MLATQWAKGIHKRQIWHQLNRGLPWAIKERQVWVQRKSLKLGPLICLAQKLQASTHKLNIHFIDIRKKIWWVEPDWLLGSSEWISHRDSRLNDVDFTIGPTGPSDSTRVTNSHLGWQKWGSCGSLPNMLFCCSVICHSEIAQTVESAHEQWLVCGGHAEYQV